MNTRDKIIHAAIELFNQEGVNNVRLQDIAKHVGISAGNLAYHFKLKKDLIEAVLQHMTHQRDEMRRNNLSLLEQDDYINLTKSYITFQIDYRFFYRDILDIIKVSPDTRALYRKQIDQAIQFVENGMYLATGKGYILPEPHEGHFRSFAKNVWAILNSALTERAVFDEEEVMWKKTIEDIWEFHVPYFTDKGKKIFYHMKDHFPQIISDEMDMLGSQ